MPHQLFQFQKEGIDFLSRRRYALLADEMGLGKTVQAILASHAAGHKKNLVISPATIKYNWQKEITKWTPESSVCIIEGRKKQVLPRVNYTVVNYDLLSARNVLIPLLNETWDSLIIDEAHYLKNNQAKRTKAVYCPKGIRTRAKSVWLLTGTPVLNRPIELYSHLSSLIPAQLGKYLSRMAFSKKFCDAGFRDISYWCPISKKIKTKKQWDERGASNLDELSKILSTFMLRREKKDVLKELPDKMYQTIYLTGDKELIKEERRIYENTKNGILGELASVRRQTGIGKVDQVVEHITNILEEKRKVVVFAYHRDVISLLREQLISYNPAVIEGSTKTSERQCQVGKFVNDDTCRAFIGQIEAAGTGIDGLQNVSDTVVFAELSYVPGQIHQAIDRCHRIGQTNKVLIQFMALEGSIDEDISFSVAKKEKIIKCVVKKSETVIGEAENQLSRIAKAVERASTYRFI